jgi:hypothetical protein
VRARLADPRTAFWCAVVACVGLLALSVTNVSLWIDEGFIAWAVDHRTPFEIARALIPPYIPSPADRQYPLYDLWMWVWTRAFGSGEYALRSANLPFGALYVVALALTCRYGFRRRFAWIPLAFAPFIWYYMNEARPYLMLAAFATCAAGATAVYAFGPPSSSRHAREYILPAFFIAWATHILAVLLLPGIIVTCAIAARYRRDISLSSWSRPLLIWAIPLVALAVFYGLTLTGGRIVAEVGNNQNRGGSLTSFAAEVVYEHAGLSGLGPARNALREFGGLAASTSYAVPLFLGIVGLVLAVWLGAREGGRRTAVCFAAWAVSFALAIVASELLHARFLGRHLAAVFPLLAIALMSLVRTRLQFALVLAVFAASDLRLALVPDYWKDDYRSAVTDVIERQAQGGGAIDWVADDLTANYYGLSLAGDRQAKGAVPVPWPVLARGTFGMDLRPASTMSLLSAQLHDGKPVYVAISKGDVFDYYHGWHDAIELLHPDLVAEYRTFSIYRFGGREAARKRRTSLAGEPSRTGVLN